MIDSKIIYINKTKENKNFVMSRKGGTFANLFET